MSEPADSTLDSETTEAPSGDSPSSAQVSGQEQGDQKAERRINSLMSLANRRLHEKEAAEAEIESLREQLAAFDANEPEQPTQHDLMFPPPPAQEPEPEPDPEAVEHVRMDSNSAPRSRSSSSYRPEPAGASASFVSSQRELADMRSQLDAANADWAVVARQEGWLD